MLMAEIVDSKLLSMNLMHRATRVCNRANLVCIEFFPINGLSFTIVLCVTKKKEEPTSNDAALLFVKKSVLKSTFQSLLMVRSYKDLHIF